MKLLAGLLALAISPALLVAQMSDLVWRSRMPDIAVPEFRCAGAGRVEIQVFNEALMDDVRTSKRFSIVSRSMFPVNVPQSPRDLELGRYHGFTLADWAAPPTSARYLVMGYGAVTHGVLVVYAWLYDVRPAGGLVLERRYTDTLERAGAERIAHRLAADTLGKVFGW